MKFHNVPEELLGEVVADINSRYDACPTIMQEIEVLALDLGRAIMMSSKPFEFEIDGYRFSIKPEHLDFVKERWVRTRERAGLIKVYGAWDCYLMTKDLHTKVGEKLEEITPFMEEEYRKVMAHIKRY